MRTTLDIDDDVLNAVKDVARRERKTAGQVISDLIRRALTEPAGSAGGTAATAREPGAFHGFRPIPSSGATVTNDLIDRLRDAEGI